MVQCTLCLKKGLEVLRVSRARLDAVTRNLSKRFLSHKVQVTYVLHGSLPFLHPFLFLHSYIPVEINVAKVGNVKWEVM